MKTIITVSIDVEKRQFMKDLNLKPSQIMNNAIASLIKKRDNEDRHKGNSSK